MKHLLKWPKSIAHVIIQCWIQPMVGYNEKRNNIQYEFGTEDIFMMTCLQVAIIMKRRKK